MPVPGLLAPGGRDRMRQPTPFPRTSRTLPGPTFLFSRPGPVGSPAPPASHPARSLRHKSPEGHDHHQGYDGPLQEARADAGLLRDHRRRLRKREEAERPGLREPLALPTGVLLEVGVPGGLIPMGQRQRKGKQGWAASGSLSLESGRQEREPWGGEAPVNPPTLPCWPPWGASSCGGRCLPG